MTIVAMSNKIRQLYCAVPQINDNIGTLLPLHKRPLACKIRDVGVLLPQLGQVVQLAINDVGYRQLAEEELVAQYLDDRLVPLLCELPVVVIPVCNAGIALRQQFHIAALGLAAVFRSFKDRIKSVLSTHKKSDRGHKCKAGLYTGKKKRFTGSLWISQEILRGCVFVASKMMWVCFYMIYGLIFVNTLVDTIIMKQDFLPKVNTSNLQSQKANKFVSEPNIPEVSNNNESIVSFNFEVITPLMQMQERNSAYKFFSI